MIHLEQSVDLVLNSLWDWERVQRLKQRSDMASFTAQNGAELRVL